MSILEIENLSHSFGDTVLFRDAGMVLNKGEHVGIVGQNGVGKSTLIRFCTGQLIPDQGRVIWQPGIKTGYLDQYAQANEETALWEFLRSAYQGLFDLEREMEDCYRRAGEGDESALERAAELQEQLEAGGFYTIDTRINRVLFGLGLDVLGPDRPLGQMSGGQRAKAILAKLLLEEPDVLLLDEPTNFLDQEQVAWLADYLSGLENAFLVVTHDHAFLEKISTSICDISEGKITKYRGSYSEFLKKRELLREDYLRRYTAQQREIKRTEEFIRRNIAGQRTKMAQGRRKQLERLERLEAPDLAEIKPFFRFSSLAVTEAEQLSVSRLSVGYDFPLLPGLTFRIRGGEKVVISGFNGVGKTTLLKTLMGELAPLGGKFAFSPRTALGYFEQDLCWEDPEFTPLQVVSNAWPGLSQKEIRQRLAHSGISNKHAAQALGTLSGGEQAKVKLCLLTKKPCNFLMLDEPTNHLDANAKEALGKAIREFPGTVLLVSHEEAFYRDWADRVIAIGRGA